MTENATHIRKSILALISEHSSSKSIDPTEIARMIAGNNEKDWRLLMKPIRTEAVVLAKEGLITILRKGKTVDPEKFKGVYRLRATNNN